MGILWDSTTMTAPTTLVLMLSHGSAGEDSCESLRQQGDLTTQFKRKSTLNTPWKDWCWSWSSNTLASWCRELTYWKRPWWLGKTEGRKRGGDRGWDSWMVSLTQWTWVWANSRRWWRTGKPGVLQSMGVTKSQTQLSNWTELIESKKKKWILQYQ